ncbi:hypothetical protein GOODEAATRI_020790 [Goodea atripinnis]|uniref:Uncharacterized protein n=1 Tax=Goodea atripinnis TaxID=208336 RepID=A0ABV0NCB2_9TELE
MIDYFFVDFLPLPIVSLPVLAFIMNHDTHTFLCFSAILQSKSVSSTDSQPTEEHQGPSGGYSALQGGAEAKRRRCDDKEPLPPHSYVCVSVSFGTMYLYLNCFQTVSYLVMNLNEAHYEKHVYL